jgi:hypothetical protein
MFRGKDVQEIEELQRQGLSGRAISDLTGYDRKTIRKYLAQGTAAAVYGPRTARPGKLDPFKPYLDERLKAGVWNAQVLLRELKERHYDGGYTILTDWLHPQREAARVVAVRRFETPPGKQAQVDWGHLGWLGDGRQRESLWALMRKDIVKNIDEVYRIRSAFVHHGQTSRHVEASDRFLIYAWTTFSRLMDLSTKHQTKAGLVGALAGC